MGQVGVVTAEENMRAAIGGALSQGRDAADCGARSAPRRHSSFQGEPVLAAALCYIFPHIDRRRIEVLFN